MKLSKLLFQALVLFLSFSSVAQKPTLKLAYSVTMEDPGSHQYHVSFQITDIKTKFLDLKMPVWTPGYYQLMNYSKYVSNFKAADASGNVLKWGKAGNSTWKVNNENATSITLSYDVRADGNFVAENILDENRGFITPAGLFLYPIGYLTNPITVQLTPYSKWKDIVATGLDSIAGAPHSFLAPNFDILYDSPILMGDIEQLTCFEVKGVPHYFTGYKLGDFDREKFISDLQKMVEGAVAIFGEIPYKHYTFLAIGPGMGGKEQLNSTAIAFDGNKLNTPEGRNRLYNFLTHEYFHHYNVKRIRPVELGPFNYDDKNRTKMLWVSEGLTVYYPYLILRKAGLMTEQEVFDGIRKDIVAYENKPGHLFQSATQASYQTWEFDPFGAPNDNSSKTISYYNKGAILGAMLDFKIRHETKNTKSLDDVMRSLYQKWYKQLKRGFTEREFWFECETVAEVSVQELFEYSTTVKEIDYPKYFAYAGLNIDTTYREIPGAWLGATVRNVNDSLVVGEVTWESPAWNAGLRSGMTVLELDNKKTSAEAFNNIGKDRKDGAIVTLNVLHKGSRKEITITLKRKLERSFEISRMSEPDKLQAAIFKSLFGTP